MNNRPVVQERWNLQAHDKFQDFPLYTPTPPPPTCKRHKYMNTDILNTTHKLNFSHEVFAGEVEVRF